jgi:hypothetical protein
LASNRQLWRLNQAGRLRIVPESGPCITVAAADDVIRGILKAELPGLHRFPRQNETFYRVGDRYRLEEPWQRRREGAVPSQTPERESYR